LLRHFQDYGTAEVADHAIALALTLRRGILHYHTLWLPSPLSSGIPSIPLWEPTTSNLIQRPSVRTFGVLGLGRIGTAAALRAKAFGFHVIFYDPHLPNGVDRALAIERVRSLESLFARSDTLSIHVPLTPDTAGIVSEPLLRRMPPGGIVINTSRGPTLDIDALYKCLKDGTLAGAALDVLPQEPPEEPLHPLYQAYQAQEEWIRGKFVITPHAAFHSPESWQDIRVLSAQCMREVLCEGLNTNVIPPESW
jgi:C-terminal binding protein